LRLLTHLRHLVAEELAEERIGDAGKIALIEGTLRPLVTVVMVTTLGATRLATVE
jgi:hypothetical protein